MKRRRWQDRCSRLTAMTPAEVYDRLRQYGTARFDLMRYKIGLGFEEQLRDTGVAQKPRFFFSADQVPGLCALLRQRFPKQADEIVQRAARICQHRFDLLGYEDLSCGTEIDWHCDRIHNKRAPIRPWFTIRYLDFGEVGDSKITWELNRHQHLVTLAKAYRLTGDDKFAAELFRQWKHWHRENPYPIGINWASSLEVALRSLSWLWVYYLLDESSALPNDFRTEWLLALGVNAHHIEQHLSTYFSPNTHLLGEAVALFFIGTLCPELRSAEKWRQRGWQSVLQTATRQVRADGLHFEQSTYYHVYALDFFLHARILASINDVPVPREFDRTLEKMLDAVCILSRAGTPPQLGDDDGGRVFDQHRNRPDHMLDPLATGAVLFGRGDFKSLAVGPREETLWLLGERSISDFDRLPVTEPARNSIALEASGLYLMSHPEAKEQLVIDAGPQGMMNAGHGHADALSVTANADGRALLIDPGAFQYVGANSDRHLFRGTRAHNTLQVDGIDQAEPNGPFGWVKLPNVKAERWISGQYFDLFVGSHDGYLRPGLGVVHRRFVFALKSKFWLIRDLALGAGEHRLDLSWHLGPGLSVQRDSDNTFIDEDGRGLRVLTVEGHGWSQEVSQEWYAPVYGRKEPGNVLRFSTVTSLPTEFVSLLLPCTITESDECGIAAHLGKCSIQEGVRAYTFELADEEHSIFFATGGRPWQAGSWSSDAEFLYWGKARNGKSQRLICCNGSYVRVGGKPIISSQRQVERHELIGDGQRIEVFSSDQSTVVNTETLRVTQAEFAPVLTSGLPDSAKRSS